jgi:immunity protein 17 of polymorphic toxin system
MNPAGLLLVGAGIFTLCGAGFDWEWFMNHRKARLFVMLFGRMGARIFYGILGLVLVVMGALLTTGAIVSR